MDRFGLVPTTITDHNWNIISGIQYIAVSTVTPSLFSMNMMNVKFMFLNTFILLKGIQNSNVYLHRSFC